MKPRITRNRMMIMVVLAGIVLLIGLRAYSVTERVILAIGAFLLVISMFTSLRAKGG